MAEETVELKASTDDGEVEEENKDENVREGSVDLDELYKNELWYLSSSDIENYHQFFVEADLNNDGFISGYEANKFFQSATLDRKQLHDIWSLCDNKRSGKISEAMFYVMFHIIFKINKSEGALTIPSSLPECLKYEVIEKLRLNVQLKNANNNDKDQVLEDIEKFKEEQRKKREEILAHIRRNENRTEAPKQLSEDEIREERWRKVREKYTTLVLEEWYFNDILGIKQGPYSIDQLVECWRNSEIEATTDLWKGDERYKAQKVHNHSEIYSYFGAFKHYEWYYVNNSNIEKGPFRSYTMKEYVQNKTIKEETKIRRVPPLENVNNDGDAARIYVELEELDVFNVWKKSVKSDTKNEGYLIQDTATMFLHNLSYYFFAVNLLFDSREYKDDKLSLLATIAMGLCIFESILNSLGQFELKERFIPFKHMVTPIAVIQLILEYFINLPMIIIEIYYLYYIKWNNDIFNDDINSAIYVSFGGYILYNIYKIGVLHFHHYDEFMRDSQGRHQYNSKEEDYWQCCTICHSFNWAFCVPTVFIVFGAVYFNNNNNDYVLSLALVIIGCISCCCLTCFAAIFNGNF